MGGNRNKIGGRNLKSAKAARNNIAINTSSKMNNWMNSIQAGKMNA